MKLWEGFKDRFCCKPRPNWGEVCDDLILKIRGLSERGLWVDGIAISKAVYESLEVLRDGKGSQPFELSMHAARQRRNLVLTAGVSLASGWRGSTDISAAVMSWAGIAAGVAESTVLVTLVVSTFYQIFHFRLNAAGETRHQCDKAFGSSVTKLDPKKLNWQDIEKALKDRGRHIEVDPLRDPQIQEFLKQTRYAFRPIPGVTNYLVPGVIAVHINRERWRLILIEIGLPCLLGIIGAGVCLARLFGWLS